MKYPIYLRIAKTDGRKGYKVSAHTEPNNTPLESGNNYSGKEFHPTVSFCVQIDIPDELFNQASRVIAELNVGMKEAKVNGEIVLPEGIKIKK